MMTIVRPPANSARALCGIIMVVATVSMALWHVHAQQDTLSLSGLLRLSVSLGAVAVVYAARRQTFLKQAMYVLAVEATGGILAFVLVDVPFVQGHRAEIGTFAVGVYERFSERSP